MENLKVTKRSSFIILKVTKRSCFIIFTIWLIVHFPIIEMMKLSQGNNTKSLNSDDSIICSQSDTLQVDNKKII